MEHCGYVHTHTDTHIIATVTEIIVMVHEHFRSKKVIGECFTKAIITSSSPGKQINIGF